MLQVGWPVKNDLWAGAIVSYIISKKGRAGQWKEKLNIES